MAPDLGSDDRQGPALIMAGQRLAAFPPCIDERCVVKLPLPFQEFAEPPVGGGCEAGPA